MLNELKQVRHLEELGFCTVYSNSVYIQVRFLVDSVHCPFSGNERESLILGGGEPSRCANRMETIGILCLDC